jgi:hypothetical protein
MHCVHHVRIKSKLFIVVCSPSFLLKYLLFETVFDAEQWVQEK